MCFNDCGTNTSFGFRVSAFGMVAGGLVLGYVWRTSFSEEECKRVCIMPIYFDEGQHPEPTVGCLSKSMSLPGCKYLDVFYNVFGAWLRADHVFGTL